MSTVHRLAFASAQNLIPAGGRTIRLSRLDVGVSSGLGLHERERRAAASGAMIAGSCSGSWPRGEVEGAVTRFSLHSIEAMYRSDMMATFLSNVDRSLGLNVQETSTAEEREVAELAKKMRRDFDGAPQYYVAKKLGAGDMVSFDRHFDGPDVPRVERASPRSGLRTLIRFPLLESPRAGEPLRPVDFISMLNMINNHEETSSYQGRRRRGLQAR